MKSKMAILTFVAVGLGSIFFTGCASTNQMVPVATGPIATNSSRIVVSREKTFVGCAAPVGIIDSGRKIGEVGWGGQLVWDRIAGPMELKAVHNLAVGGNGREQPLRIGVGAGMSYHFSLTTPATGMRRALNLDLISGTTVAYEQNGTNIIPGKVGNDQQQPADGERKTLTGTLNAFPHGPSQFKSGPPLWPVGMIVVIDDNGAKNNFLVVEKGEYATTFYDVDGKVLKISQARNVGKKVEVKYVVTTFRYANKAVAISVRYFD